VAADAIAQGLMWWYGGSAEKPAQYVYANGSSIVVGGMDNPDKVMSTEYDCVIGETLVDSVSPIQRAYSRPYSGKLVTITTASGKELTGTPNHPIFTTHGWVRLGELLEGDHVVSRTGVETERVGGASPYVTDQPTRIAELARAMTLANPGGAERVETVPMDFHGDGVADSYVDVVAARSLFENGIDAALGEHLLEVERQGRHLEQSALVGFGSTVDALLIGDASPIRLALFGAEGAHARPVSVGRHPFFAFGASRFSEGSRPFGIASMPERLPLGGASVTEATLSHRRLESSSGDVDKLRGFGDPKLPFQVAPDRVVHVVIADAGPGRHVYNLQTGNSWYVANGIVSHNCIYYQEATDGTLEDWEKCTSRLRNGRVSFQQMLGDCNPQQPSHWLKKRCDDGKATMLVSHHEDNPRLFEADGTATAFGRDYLKRLDNLTGVRLQRLRYGRWVAAEGVIYEDWRPEVHLLDRKQLPLDWPRIWGVDFGYTNPFVWGMWAIDPDGRLYLEKEIYHTKRLVEDHARQILDVVTTGNGTWKYPKPIAVVCDHDAEDRATLERHLGMSTIAANKNVSEGIQAMQARVRVAGDGLPRLFVLRDSLVELDSDLKDRGLPTRFAEEIEGYVWAPTADGKPVKDEPLKMGDHAMDETRYVVAHQDLAAAARVRFINM
jgi:phage terminase large subunit